ncbi:MULTISPECIES: hypothetical protein [Sphingomonadaceae]|uniref:hypothetical protein n=1 Tax=Sphingomonadaceae TaxID=41297 RepID=UPI0011584349|nr:MULTISPECIES: hypothetical protein [Sphingomonadaceae]QDK32594.1 hypothetical protein DM450_07320 [Sphingomonas sp. IC081]QSR18545.1 hypothetical protein CA833_15335 [Novosphingobium sp. KA1]
MINSATIVGIISVIGALILVSSHSRFRELGFTKGIKLALIWALIIIALTLVIETLGMRLRG